MAGDPQGPESEPQVTGSGEPHGGATGRLNTTLAGLRVLDLTRNMAGPFCTMILGDLGADVIKIEQPGRGDDTRDWAPPSWNGESTMFLAANRNKRSVAVDLNHPEGVKIVQALARRADVLVESFRPGALERRGLGYEALRHDNERLIYCSISAFGSVGPLAGTPGYDPVLQAYTGIMSMTGEPEQPPVRLGVAALDLGAGLWATIAVQGALAARTRDQRGCRIETSLFETAVWWLSYYVSAFLATGDVPSRTGTKASFIAPYETFPTADGDLMVAAANDNLFGAFADVIGLPDLATDPRFATNPVRVANRVELRRLICERLSTAPAQEWERRLAIRTVPCSRIRTVADVVHDEQTEALGLLAAVPHPLIPDLRLVDTPFSEAGHRSGRRLPPPLLGQHTTEVLAELGYRHAEIEALRGAGTVA